MTNDKIIEAKKNTSVSSVAVEENNSYLGGEKTFFVLSMCIV